MKPPAAAATPKPTVSSSPGRPEKLPAPGFARLLRGKSASRSRARSAASPMFVSRSKSVGRSSSSAIDPALPDAGDPSSPKVTCIGQVRIRNRNRNRNNRKKNKSNSTTKTSSRSADPYRCQCLCRLFLCRSNKKCYSPYRFFFCWRKQKQKKKKKVKETAEAAPPIAFVREFKIESDLEEEDETGDEETRVFVSPSSAAAAVESATAHSSEDAAPPPPKNALLLMRCRSAPHNRSSALALSRFPVSAIPASETEEEEETVEERERESCNESPKDEEETRSSSTSQTPGGLIRCKSEPAKKAERLMEVSYCKWNGSGKGGMGVVQEVGPTVPPPPPPPILLH